MVPPERNFGFLMNDVARLLRKRFEQRARHLGLTRAQWQVMAHLARNEGIRQTDLAGLLEVEPITLARILDKLEATGLVERRHHPTDRRVWQLYLTATAAPLIEQGRGFAERTRAEASDGIAEADRERLIEILGRMRTNLAGICGKPTEEEGAP